MGNAKAALAYIGQIVIWILAPIIVYFIAKEDKVAKFSAVQAILLNVAAGVIFAVLFIVSLILAFIPVVNFLVLLMFPLMGLVGLIIGLATLYAAYKAWKNEMWKMPVIGGLAEKWSA